MQRGMLFWVIWVIALLFGGYVGFTDRNMRWSGMVLVIMCLLALLGWTVFGAVVK